MSQRFQSENPQANERSQTNSETDLTRCNQAEIALIESKSYLHQAIEYAPVAMVICDRQMRYLATSRKWLEDHNLTDDIIGRSHYEVFPDIPQKWKQIHQQCLAGEVAQCDADPFPQADGSFKWVRWSVRPWYTAGGEIGGVMMFSENITERQQAEIALRHSEERYRSLLTATSQMVWTNSADGFSTEENLPWREITGQTWEESQGWGWLDAIHPDDREFLAEAWETAVKTGNQYEVEFRVRHYDGEYRYMLALGIPVLETDGSIREWFGSCIDIHDRKQAEAALQESNTLLRSILESTPDFIVVKDCQGRHVALNSNLAKVYNQQIEDIIGKDDFALLPPEFAREIMAKDRQIIATGLTETYEEVVFDDIFLTTKAPWRDANGNILGIIAITRNISDRKQAELALKLSEQRHRSLIAATSQMVWTTEADGQVIDMPAWRAYTGQSLAEVTGFGWLNAIHPDDRDPTYHIWMQAVQTKSLYDTVYRVRAADGNYRYFQSRAVPIIAEDGSIQEWIGISTDIHDRKQAELALQHSEKRYRCLITATSQIVWTTDANRQVIDMPAWRAYTGQTVAEVAGLGWLDAIHPDDRDPTSQIWMQAVEAKSLYDTEYRIRAADGSYRYFQAKGVPVLGENGSIREWIGTCTDIHDRKQAELALQLSEERFRSLIEATSQIIWSTNAEGAFVTDQPHWRAFTGQSIDEIWGWGWQDMIHPDDQAETAEVWTASLTNRTLHQTETRIRRHDGEYRYLSVRGVPIVAADGSIREWVGANTDITERKQAEQRLRQTLEILDSASDSIIIRDMDDRIIYWNQGAELLYGWKREEVIGQYIHTFLETVFPKPLEIVLSEFLEQGSWEGELHHTTRDGRRIIVASRWTLQRDANGQPFTQLEINNDITERKQFEIALAKAKEAAEAASFAKSEFLANMSHELRTPLNGILGYAQILQRSKHLQEDERSRIDVIYQCGSHLLTLINDILDLSKIEAQKVELIKSDFHFPAFLQGVAEMCRIRAELKNINFQYQLASELPVGIRADEKRLRQVLINLLSNAIKFTDAGSVNFTISYAAEGKIRFEVRDTGIGIAQEKHQAIFQPFEQAGDNRRQTEGTGLGLAISQRIVELMGSTIQVQSELGIGSIFWFDVNLPAADEWIKTSQADDYGQIIGIKNCRPKILVADDKWENRSVIANLLAPIGFEVAEARDGQEGWQKVCEFQPDLVITDLLMPELDGFGLIKCIRESEAFKHISIIVSSASVFESDRHRSLEMGGDDFLPKPVQAMELFQKLRQHLHLEWIYEEQNTLSQPERDNTALVAPPTAEIEILYELVMKGNFKGIIKQAAFLEQLDEKYIPLAKKLQQLAKGFQDQEILALVQSLK
ncbi:PAS domain S-box protein [Nostoc sp. CENA67]|uniref:Circadian input-output histidine kinase CikA n=1 Tax=Amazonocrinis nigriterrae CENA67 TaxID=2794033 RepID=A0A8J7HL13_9NOST|nr:PAS domain S-box protein [Amazonocrinis nigriterrae]MBH8561147.1 PAS domain S-box protein [Amazonocrinis nigriterrae CENA67]